MYNHALCVYPYRQDTSDGGVLPPLGIELIAAALEPNCQTIEIADLRKQPGRTANFLRPETDLVCFSVNWKRDVDFICEEINSVPPDVFVLVGGRHATEDPEAWFTACPNIDAVGRGDGEEVVGDMCRGADLPSIAGLSYRSNGNIVHNPNRILGDLRDDLVPARHLREASYQLGFQNAEIGIEMDLVSSTRGCPFNCSFCSFSRNPWGEKRKWTARSPESVVDELASLDAPLVGFTDDLFTFDMDRVEKICDLLLARGIRKKYIINARLEVARRPDVLRKMKQAGFFMLMLGVESAHDKTLRSMGKGFDTKRIRECFDELRRSQLILHGYFILGCIGESADDMRAILPFAKELGLDTIAISTLRSSPHTGLETLVAENPGYHIAPNGKIYSDECSVDELQAIRRGIYREFFTAGQLLRVARKGIRNGALRFLPSELPRLPKMSWVIAKHRRRRKRIRRAKEAALLEARREKARRLASD